MSKCVSTQLIKMCYFLYLLDLSFLINDEIPVFILKAYATVDTTYLNSTAATKLHGIRSKVLAFCFIYENK